MPRPPETIPAGPPSPVGFQWASNGVDPSADMSRFMVHIASVLDTLQRQQSLAWQQQVQQTQLLQQLQGCPQPERKDPEPAPNKATPDSASSALVQDLALQPNQKQADESALAVFDQEKKLEPKATLAAPKNSTDSSSSAPLLADTSAFQVLQFHESVLKRKVDPEQIMGKDIHKINHQMDKLDKAKNRVKVHSKDWCQYLYPQVRGPHWELTFGSIIMLNTVVMSFQMQCIGMQLGQDMQLSDGANIPAWTDPVFAAINDAFLVVFVVEIIVKLVVLRSSFWKVHWDVIDFLVVFVGIVVRMLTDFVDVGIDPVIIRLFRLIRLARFMKMFKLAGNMHSMNLIIKSVLATRGTLFWSMMLLFMVQWIAGMFLGQMVQQFLGDTTADLDARMAVYRYYGTFTKTQFTMFEITHVNYSSAARVLVDNISEWWCWFFVAYRCLVAFAFLQVIRSVFIQMTLKVADRDKDLVIHNKRASLRELHSKLGDIFNLLELDGDGAMSFDEFVHQLNKDSTKIWLSALDIDVSDPEGLFELLDLKGNGEVSQSEFTFGAAQLRGPAQSRDLFHLQTLVERTEAKLDTLMPIQFRGKVFPLDRKSLERQKSGILDENCETSSP